MQMNAHLIPGGYKFLLPKLKDYFINSPQVDHRHNHQQVLPGETMERAVGPIRLIDGQGMETIAPFLGLCRN